MRQIFCDQPRVKKQITCTIDGRSVTVEEGTTILHAARKLGLYVPTLCYMEKLNPIGSCRMCVVEVEGMEGVVTSCQVPVSEGIKVTTQSERLAEERALMVRMMLVNHPLDCPICERSGECLLQDTTVEFKQTSPKYRADKQPRKKHMDWGLVRYDPNLCIMCERCIKVCTEVQGVSAFKIVGRGFDSQIGTVTGEKLDCEFCGQCISVCPVGALNSGVVLSARSWELKKTKTICPHCAVGCTYDMNTKRHRIIRVTTDDFAGINNGNLCAMGRFGYRFIESGERIKTPLLKKNGNFQPISWEEACRILAGRLRKIQNDHGVNSVAGIGSERATNESNYLFQKFFRTVLGTHQVNSLSNMRSPAWNSELFDRFPSIPLIRSVADIDSSTGVVFFQADGAVENPVIGNIVRRAIYRNNAEIFAFGHREIEYKPYPRVSCAHRVGEEVTVLKGLVRTVLELDLVDRSTLQERIANLDELVSSANDSPGRLAESVRGFEPEQWNLWVRDLAQHAGKGTILIGKSVYINPNAESILNWIQNLAAVLNMKPMLYREFCNSQGVNDMGVSPFVLPGYRPITDLAGLDRIGKTWNKKLTHLMRPVSNVFSAVLSEDVAGLWIMGEDCLTRWRPAKEVEEALKRVRLLVVQDSFLTETAKLAELVLPSSTFAEQDGTFTNMEGRVQRVCKTIPNIGQSKADWEIIRMVAAEFGAPGFAYTNVEGVFQEIRQLIPAYSSIDPYAAGFDGAIAQYPWIKPNGHSLRLRV
jgi:formate dehydrogenase alpha subunit